MMHRLWCEARRPGLCLSCSRRKTLTLWRATGPRLSPIPAYAANGSGTEVFEAYLGLRHRIGGGAFQRRLKVAARAAEIAKLPPQQPTLHQRITITGLEFQRRLDIGHRILIAF